MWKVHPTANTKIWSQHNASLTVKFCPAFQQALSEQVNARVYNTGSRCCAQFVDLGRKGGGGGQATNLTSFWLENL